MTPGLLRIFKDRLKLEKMRNLDKSLVWAIATMAFWGSLRIHVICATSAKEFSAADTLCWGDIKLDEVGVRDNLPKISLP